MVGPGGRRYIWMTATAEEPGEDHRIFRREKRKKEGRSVDPQAALVRAEARRKAWSAMIDGVSIRTKADLARHLGVSRARVTQVLGSDAVRTVRADSTPSIHLGTEGRDESAAGGAS